MYYLLNCFLLFSETWLYKYVNLQWYGMAFVAKMTVNCEKVHIYTGLHYAYATTNVSWRHSPIIS